MAKKRRKDREKEEEEYEFKPPEFDEKEFLQKELFDTRVVMYTVIFGVAFGVAAGVISILDNTLVAVAGVLVVAGIVGLKWLYALVKIDTKKFLKRNWVGNIGTFFFTFLAIWILLINQPFADFAKPTVTNVTVWVANPGNITAIDYKFNKDLKTNIWSERFGEPIASVIKANSTLNITAKIADDHGLSSVTISVRSAPFVGMVSEPKNRWGYSLAAGSVMSGSSGSLAFIISAVDDSDNSILFDPAPMNWP